MRYLTGKTVYDIDGDYIYWCVENVIGRNNPALEDMAQEVVLTINDILLENKWKKDGGSTFKSFVRIAIESKVRSLLRASRYTKIGGNLRESSVPKKIREQIRSEAHYSLQYLSKKYKINTDTIESLLGGKGTVSLDKKLKETDRIFELDSECLESSFAPTIDTEKQWCERFIETCRIPDYAKYALELYAFGDVNFQLALKTAYRKYKPQGIGELSFEKRFMQFFYNQILDAYKKCTIGEEGKAEAKRQYIDYTIQKGIDRQEMKRREAYKRKKELQNAQ
jgi:hypothetical protein